MIKVENATVFNIEGALRGMRNPMNSWDKSDSYYDEDGNYVLGEKDLELCKKLIKAGNEHRKFLRQIFISMDITAPLYWWAEMDTYKVGTTRNSCSFMHRGVSKPFEITDFSIHDDRVYEILSPIQKQNYELIYKYPSSNFKIYTGNNGRKYKVYSNGKVIATRFEYVDTMNRHRVLEERECVPSKTKSGYFELNLGGKSGEKWLLHRLVATLFLDNPNNCYTVNHIDGDKGNNCVENLEWCDLSDNIKKGFEEGLYENGKSLHAKYMKWKNGHVVVDPFIKSQILNDHNANNVSCKELAMKYNISISQANNIISGELIDDQELFMLCYAWETLIDTLNNLRDSYLETKDNSIFQQIRCLLPSGYNQRSTITMNYENVFNIIHQRENHKLDEWREFVKMLLGLPYVNLFLQ